MVWSHLTDSRRIDPSQTQVFGDGQIRQERRVLKYGGDACCLCSGR